MSPRPPAPGPLLLQLEARQGTTVHAVNIDTARPAAEIRRAAHTALEEILDAKGIDRAPVNAASTVRHLRDQLRGTVTTEPDHAIPHHRADEALRDIVETVLHEES